MYLVSLYFHHDAVIPKIINQDRLVVVEMLSLSLIVLTIRFETKQVNSLSKTTIFRRTVADMEINCIINRIWQNWMNQSAPQGLHGEELIFRASVFLKTGKWNFIRIEKFLNNSITIIRKYLFHEFFMNKLKSLKSLGYTTDIS